jgi:hypothetical protein
MPTPSSGAISIQQINAEFGRGNNLNAYRGTTWWTPQGTSGTFSSGAIAMSEFYNKQPNPPTFSFTISTNQTNANLRTLAVNAGWNQAGLVIATISSGVYISSNSTGTPALTVSGSFPAGVQLVNNGFIVGMGGAGGRGGGMTNWTAVAGTAGSSGGTGLSVSSAITITNNGTIAGGGGGGGGGQSRTNINFPCDSYPVSGGGGGGGRSSNAANSAAGAAGTATGTVPRQGAAGGAGTVSSAGGGGAGGFFNSNTSAGAGGAGGGWGASGSTGVNGFSNYNPPNSSAGPYSGGGAGSSVVGNGNISWAAFGTRLGPIS